MKTALVFVRKILMFPDTSFQRQLTVCCLFLRHRIVVYLLNSRFWGKVLQKSVSTGFESYKDCQKWEEKKRCSSLRDLLFTQTAPITGIVGKCYRGWVSAFMSVYMERRRRDNDLWWTLSSDACSVIQHWEREHQTLIHVHAEIPRWSLADPRVACYHTVM